MKIIMTIMMIGIHFIMFCWLLSSWIFTVLAPTALSRRYFWNHWGIIVAKNWEIAIITNKTIANNVSSFPAKMAVEVTVDNWSPNKLPWVKIALPCIAPQTAIKIGNWTNRINICLNGWIPLALYKAICSWANFCFSYWLVWAFGYLACNIESCGWIADILDWEVVVLNDIAIITALTIIVVSKIAAIWPQPDNPKVLEKTCNKYPIG